MNWRGVQIRTAGNRPCSRTPYMHALKACSPRLVHGEERGLGTAGVRHRGRGMEA